VSVAQIIGEMIANKVALVIPGQGIDTSNHNSAARLQMNILMAVAEFERDIIRERTLAGLAAARSRGVTLGRPRLEVSPDAEKRIRAFAKSPLSKRESYRILAGELGLSVGKTHALVAGLARRGVGKSGRARRMR
jgi:DNA invertase Pin-like site-specific DNA recombinase